MTPAQLKMILLDMTQEKEGTDWHWTFSMEDLAVLPLSVVPSWFRRAALRPTDPKVLKRKTKSNGENGSGLGKSRRSKNTN